MNEGVDNALREGHISLVRHWLIGLAMLLMAGVGRSELFLPSALPTQALMAMDAVITDVRVSENLLTITFTGTLATSEDALKGEAGKTNTHRVTIQLDSKEEAGAFNLLAAKAESLKGRTCTLDIVTTLLRSGGSGFLIFYGTSKIDLREHLQKQERTRPGD